MTSTRLTMIGRCAAGAAALAAAMMSVPALAQGSTAARTPGKGEAQAMRIFGMLDANGDGRISLQEAEVGFRLKPSLRDDFKAADLNHDGYLTQAEIRTVAERRRAERQQRRQREAEQAARALGGVAPAARAPLADDRPAASPRTRPAVTIRTRGTPAEPPTAAPGMSAR